VEPEKPRDRGQWCEADAERLLAEFAATRDAALRARLIEVHENLVRFIAGKFANRGEPLEDLVQVGTIGLIHAVDRFEPERGIRFSTYATPTIVGEIKRYFRDRAWNLKVPRWLQELNFQVVKANDLLAQRLGRAPTVADIAEYVGCSEEEALNAMELGNAYETVSLDTHLPVDGETPITLGESIGMLDRDLKQVDAFEDVKSAMGRLDPRERTILYLRFFQDLSQTEVARRLNISQMHVSRLQHRALQRLREILSETERGEIRNAA
jgi:RNA polymerase sigma-B factor